MKEFFRFLRGELTGKYIFSLHHTLNKSVISLKSVITEIAKLQFNEHYLDFDFIINIGQVAGIFLPRISVSESFGNFRFTQSYKVGGIERSERGLMYKDDEQFHFHNTEQDIYDYDINELATEDKRSSVVGTEDELKGYIKSSERDLLTEEGNVNPDKISITKPEGIAYSDFYGDKFLMIIDSTTERKFISLKVYFELIKACQWIRYNTQNIQSFCDIIQSLCPNGLITITKFEYNTKKCCFDISYKFNTEATTGQKEERLFTFLLLVGLKFKQFNLHEEL